MLLKVGWGCKDYGSLEREFSGESNRPKEQRAENANGGPDDFWCKRTV